MVMACHGQQPQRVRGRPEAEDRGQDQHHQRLHERAHPGGERLGRDQRGR
jgi:hypothetical protein